MKYLLNPPILVVPISRKPLIMCTTTLEESLVTLIAQHNDEKKNILYYISWRLVGVEIDYSPIEKHYLALIHCLEASILYAL